MFRVGDRGEGGIIVAIIAITSVIVVGCPLARTLAIDVVYRTTIWQSVRQFFSSVHEKPGCGRKKDSRYARPGKLLFHSFSTGVALPLAESPLATRRIETTFNFIGGER